MKSNRDEETYTLTMIEESLILTTSSFKAEKGSLLHSGIFSRELSSSFIAAIFVVVFLILLSLRHQLTAVHYFLGALFFALIFPLSRIYLFKEPQLETIFDKKSGNLTMTLRKPLGKRAIKKTLDSLRDITFEHMRFEPENPDGVAFVEKIARQHGTVIPGFGEAMDFYNVTLMVANEKYTIFTTRIVSEAEAVVDRLRSFVNTSPGDPG
jgi:hypothetical protein